MRAVREFAPAKINLTLEVGPVKPNGRHPLQSVVAFADVGDWVEARMCEDGRLSLTVDGPFASALGAAADNLVLAAAEALRAAAGRPLGAALKLEKNLPVASGIGGGSSDAAATLRALNAAWSLGFSEAALTVLARPLGGDVPVCVGARSAYMTGEGETVAPVRLPTLDAVLVNPRIAVPTAAVFARFDADGGDAPLRAAPAPVWATLAAVCEGARARGNGLAAPARALAPVIGEVEALLNADLRARYVAVSGSGATVFALTANAEDAAALARDVTNMRPDWWSAATRLAALDARGGGR